MTDVPLHRHWSDIYRLRWWIVLTGLSAAAAAWMFSSLVEPIYEAKTTFFIASNTEQPSFVGALDAPPGVLYPTPEEKAASLDVGILRGRAVMEQLAERTDLPLGEVQKRVDVKVSGEFMLDVFARNPDPEKAARIANTARDLYREFHESSMRARAGRQALALEGQLAALRGERAEIEAAQVARRQETLSTADAAALQQMQEDLGQARTDLDAIDANFLETRARIASIDSALASESVYYEQGLTLDSTEIMAAMHEILLQLRVDLASNTDGPSSPRRRAMEEQIKDLETSLAREESRLGSAETRAPGSLFEELRLERALAEARLGGLAALRPSASTKLAEASAEFQQALGQIGSSEEARIQLARLDAHISTAEENLASARLQSAHASPPLVIVETAVAPTRPAFPLTILNTIVAGICGLIFGCYYALFLAHAQRAAPARRAESEPLPVFSVEEMRELRALGLERSREKPG